MNLKKSLLMPKSGFEMRGNLGKKEPVLVKNWEQINLYELMRDKNKGKEVYHLHDGPPYANGDIHVGHMLNRILKDIIIRQKNMAGYDTPFVLGWDTHGLPIETQVTKQKGVDRKNMSVADFRSLCHNYALTQVDRQKTQIKRLGVLGDYKEPYLTITPEYEAAQLEVFANLALNGLIYKGEKPVHWSPSSETALAEAEIEYADVTSHAIFVKFDILDGKGILPSDAAIVIWTTTPWTLPANLAISLHPRFEYGLYETSKGKLVFLNELANDLISQLELEDVKLLETFKGEQLEYITTKHPFYERESLVIIGEHVTAEAGTGAVHTAPGHGDDDYKIGVKYNLKPYSPVDERGHMTAEAGKRLEGLYFEKANLVVLEMLKENNALLNHSKITHSYPHDWRTQKPLIFRATPQWFMSIEAIKPQLLEAVDKVNWTPSWGKVRMHNMIVDRHDWVISRQRVWGVPIPIIYNEDGSPIMEKAVFDHIIELVRKHGSNIWFSKTAKQLLPEGYQNTASPNGEFSKETDTMDVWFDSGSSFNSVVKKRGLKYPADLYLEGSDQYRGWFNSSLILGVATTNEAPYKNILSHGFVLDENLEKMSKSRGNALDPIKIANQYGADILRLWTASTNYQSDVRIGDKVIKQTSEVYRKIRNTMKFVLGNLQDGEHEFNLEAVSKDDLFFIDKLLLNKLHDVTNKILTAYDKFQFSTVVALATNFISFDLSSFYLDFAKDILYCEAYNSKRRKAVQYVLYESLDNLMRLLTPILSFTMEDVYEYFPSKTKLPSVQLLDFPKVEKVDNNLLEVYENFLTGRDHVLKALEGARANHLIGSSQAAKVEVGRNLLPTQIRELEQSELARLFIVSHVSLTEGEEVSVKVHDGERCDRCWNYYDTPLIKVNEEEHVCSRCYEAMKENDPK